MPQHGTQWNWSFTWLEDTAWLHWLDAKLPSTLKFLSSNKKPVTADFLPSNWLAESHTGKELCFEWLLRYWMHEPKHDALSFIVNDPHLMTSSSTHLENMAFRRTRIRASFKDMLTLSRGWKKRKSNKKQKPLVCVCVCLFTYLNSF